MKEYFFDAHMHAMNLIHPSFSSFVDSVSEGFTDFVSSGALSPGYLLTPAMRGQQGLNTILNMFSVFERPIGEIFAMMEEDLHGSFASHQFITAKKENTKVTYPDKPYIRDGKFHFRSHIYDQYAMIPLVMDFSTKSDDSSSRSYYTSEEQEKILAYVQDTIDGIKWYRRVKKNGLLDFFPFLGINPAMHTLGFIEQLIDTHVRLPHTKKGRNEKFFRGIKFYPPLGTNPWPEEKKEREKIEYIYSFCERNRVPIITHCDDQGFRGINSKLAQKYTAPLSFKPALEKYPELIIDFAHYGRQYSLFGKKSIKSLIGSTFTEDPWFNQIIGFMADYEHVYADMSFSGTDPAFYKGLHSFIYQQDEPLAEKIIDRSMFGSDFSVNLAKVESYTNYLRIFEESPFSDDVIHRFASVNPSRFLQLT